MFCLICLDELKSWPQELPPRKHPADLSVEDTVNNKLQTWLEQIWGDPVFLLSTHLLTPWPSLPHGLNWHQSEPNPIKHFPELDASSMVHSHSFSSSSSGRAADQSRQRNKGGSTSEIHTLFFSCSRVVQQKPRPPNSRRLDKKMSFEPDGAWELSHSFSGVPEDIISNDKRAQR